MASDTSSLTGIFVPNVVPLHGDGQINEKELRRLVDFLIDRGVNGLYPNGSTGEFLRFTPAERHQIVSIVIDQAAGRVPVMGGAAEPTVAETIRVCEQMANLGARAAALVSPFYYHVSPEAVYAWFRAIAERSPIDITLYNIPLFASPIPIDIVDRLAKECPRIVGIKDSSGDIAHMLGMIQHVRQHRPDFKFMTGWDTTLTSMLLSGCDGGTNATANVIPEVMAGIYAAVNQNDLDRAWELQRRITPLFDAMLKLDFPIGFRIATAARGIDVGPSRLPQTGNQRAAARRFNDEIKDLVASFRDLIRY